MKRSEEKGRPVKRQGFSIANKILGLETALASDKTPERLKPSMRKYLKTLRESKAGKSFLQRLGDILP